MPPAKERKDHKTSKSVQTPSFMASSPSALTQQETDPKKGTCSESWGEKYRSKPPRVLCPNPSLRLRAGRGQSTHRFMAQLRGHLLQAASLGFFTNPCPATVPSLVSSPAGPGEGREQILSLSLSPPQTSGHRAHSRHSINIRGTEYSNE